MNWSELQDFGVSNRLVYKKGDEQVVEAAVVVIEGKAHGANCSNCSAGSGSN